MSDETISFGYVMLKESVAAIPQWDAFLQAKADALHKQAETLTASLIEPTGVQIDERIAVEPKVELTTGPPPSLDPHEAHSRPSSLTEPAENEPVDELGEVPYDKQAVAEPSIADSNDDSGVALAIEGEEEDIQEIAVPPVEQKDAYEPDLETVTIKINTLPWNGAEPPSTNSESTVSGLSGNTDLQDASLETIASKPKEVDQAAT